MLRDGYAATRVDDVIREAGLSKGSFYHFFESKEALGLAALEHYYADRVGRLAAGHVCLRSRCAASSPRLPGACFPRRRGLVEPGCLLANSPSTRPGRVEPSRTRSGSEPANCGRCLPTCWVRLRRRGHRSRPGRPVPRMRRGFDRAGTHLRRSGLSAARPRAIQALPERCREARSVKARILGSPLHERRGLCCGMAEGAERRGGPRCPFARSPAPPHVC